MSDLVSITIDGRQVKVKPNTLLVEAAAQVGILIPVYCYHPKLAPIGACRMCLVEVEGTPKLIASCTTPVREGMVVHTNNSRVEKARQGMLEFLLIHHPLDCPVCDKGSECPLQDFTYRFGPSKSRYNYPKRHWEKPVLLGKNILLDRERCIMCFRCVRFCEEISDHKQIGAIERGNNQFIGTAEGKPFDSQFSGNTIELCPVGALTGKPTRFFGRAWELGHTPSVCTGCAAGCNVRVDTRYVSEIVRLWSRENPHTDDGWLCDAGRFGFQFVNENRLETPMVRRDSRMDTVNWPEAIDSTNGVLSRHAADGTLGILYSPRLTNEEIWSLSKFAHRTLRTENLDYKCDPGGQAAANPYTLIKEAGFMPGLLSNLNSAQQIIIIGTDVSADQPVTDLRIKKAIFNKHSDLVILNPAEVELSQYTPHNLIYKLGEEAQAISTLANAVASPASAEGLYQAAGASLASPAQKCVIIGWRVMKTEDVGGILNALTMLAEALGPDTPCIVIVEHCNTHGALDLNVAWEGLPGAESSLSGHEILQAAADGRIKALWLLGEEPLADAEPELIKRALENVEMLIYQGWSLPGGLPREPDIALPSTTFAEMEGTFTNTDGRVQRLFKAIRAPGLAKPGWEIISNLAGALENGFSTGTAVEIFEEIAHEVPAYRGLTWARLGTSGAKSSSGVDAVVEAAG